MPDRDRQRKKRPTESAGTNKEQIFDLIQGHPEGLDDDDISELSGIGPRQQVQHLCTQLALSDRIRRESVSKAGKRRKIHNFPWTAPRTSIAESDASWRRRLANLVAVTGRAEEDLLDEALLALAMKILAASSQAEWSVDRSEGSGIREADGGAGSRRR